MVTSEKEIAEVKTDVELLKRDVIAMQNLFSRLDTAIDQIATVSNGIQKMLAVHQAAIDTLKGDAGERVRLSEKENDLLHKRISDMKDESAKERKENHEAVMNKLDRMSTETKNEIQTLGERVRILERWKWWIMGGSWAIGFIIATLFQVGSLIQAFSV
jgi:hypothetical protein